MPVERTRTSEYEGIMVIGECSNGILKPVLNELLGCALELNKKLDTEIAAVLIGDQINRHGDTCIRHGADKVYLIDYPVLNPINEEIYTELLHQIISDNKPEIVLMPSTTHSKSLAARLASRLNTGLTADCTSLDIDVSTRTLLQIRPAREGALMATVSCPDARPQMATIRQGVMSPSTSDPDRTGKIIYPRIQMPSKVNTKILDVVTHAAIHHSGESEIIVAVGRGIQSKEGLDMIRELVVCLRADLGATRPVVDQGWLDYSRQIGLTGKNVSGRIYIAIGLSGAIQHTVGIKRMDTVIAINQDKNAPIFGIATHGIVADLFEAVPMLIDKVKQNMAVSR
ncbi:electron transfer flavoprotein subunit alpha/FixB family protein [Paenibacillus sp. BR2-3]|uniref:electron transfer flavoprotein subunit alpha/FixB family protein n=1 Tax=Paenibacillus sp. BR2-3 TaxID=3048494 RepID=UPI00397798DA